MVIRTALEGDRENIVKVCKEALTCDAQDAGLLPALLWESPGGRPDLKLVAESDRGIVGVALSALRIDGDGPPLGYIDLLAVSPEAQRQGYGRSLLAAAEKGLQSAGVTEVHLGGNAPCYAWPGIDLNYTAAIKLAESGGYSPLDEAFNMIVDLSVAPLDTATAEQRFAEAGITIRPLSEADEPGFSSWVAEHWYADWAWEATRAFVRTGARCHVATRGPDLIAFAACGSTRPSWFGPMGTVPAEERKGLGSVLLKRCLTDLRAAGMSHCDIAWVGPPDFYSKSVGATVDRLFRFYRKVL